VTSPERIGITVQSGYFDGPRGSNPGPAPDQLDACAVHPSHLAVVLPVGGERVPALENRGGIQGLGNGFACARHCLRRVQCGTRAQQRLGRHAGPIRAFAAHEFRFDQHRRQASLHHAVGDVFTGGAGSDHNDIDFPLSGLWRHGYSLRPPNP
jgi:hypothetical protein